MSEFNENIGYQSDNGNYSLSTIGNPVANVYGTIRNTLGYFKKPAYDDFASRTWAELTRERFADARNTFRPLSDYLRAVVNNPMERATAVQGARNLTEGSLRDVEGQTARRLGGYGLTMTSGQEESQRRSLGLSRSLADVDAVNRTNQAVDERDLQLAGGGVASAAGSLSGINNLRRR